MERDERLIAQNNQRSIFRIDLHHHCLLNILSSTRRNFIKQVTRRVKTKCGFSQHIKQDTHHMVKNCRGGRDAEIDRRNKPYTDAMESLLKR